MAIGVTVEHGAAGLEVRKHAHDAEGARRLAHEAAILERARHPGVVDLLRHDPGGTGRAATLVTVFVGNHSLATAPPTTAPAIAACLASLASTVAELHSLGVAHRHLDPRHVLLDRYDRPRLCGFTRARTPELQPPPDTDHAPDTDDGIGEPTSPALDRSEDVRQLGRLIHDLLDRGEPTGPPWRHRSCRRALHELADRATHDDPMRRPDARALARALAEWADDEACPRPAGTSPDARDASGSHSHTDLIEPSALDHPPHDADLDGGEPRRARADDALDRRWRATVIGAASVGAFLLAAAALLAVTGRPATPTRAGAPAAPRTTPPTASGTATASVPCRTDDPPSTADVDGDGCADDLQITDTTIVAGPRTFQVGRDGDRVTVGDWDCDGRGTPGVLRPTSGEVFLFADWGDGTGDVMVTAAIVRPGSSRLDVDPHGCGPPVLLDPEGRRLDGGVGAEGGAGQ